MKNTKVLAGIIFALLILALGIVIFKNKKVATPPQSEASTAQNVAIVDKQEVAAEQAEEKPGTTIDGIVIALGEKTIAISNNTSNPDEFTISAKTPVVKFDKAGNEITAGLADALPGAKARVLYLDENINPKVAEKIFLLEN